MTPGKRLFDITLALLLSVVLVPLGGVIALVILILDGPPVFYVAERMKAPDRPFRLWKFRTMRAAADDTGVSGAHKAARVTPVGRFLRRTRFDELPQLWNVLRGDISFVGPRPPLRMYVERFPALYAEVLKSRPGITGMASVFFHRHEELILAQCGDAAATDAAYAGRCVPRKARLDLIYQRRRSLRLDLWLIGLTAAQAFGLRRRGRETRHAPRPVPARRTRRTT